jgi:hypothetical protein
MKYLLLLLLLPLISAAQSNDEMLYGVWVKAKAEMADGSRIVDRNGCGMSFVKYSFTPDGFVNMSNEVLFNGFKTKYKLSGDSLLVGGTLFNLLRLTNDTLKVSLFAAGVDDNQLPVFYFVKLPQRNANVKATYDAALKDSVYQANNIFFPQCKGTFNDVFDGIPGKYDKGSFKISFVIDKKGRVKNYTVLSLDSVSKSFANQPRSTLNSLNWEPAQRNGLPVDCIVQLTIKTGNKSFGTHNYSLNTIAIDYDFVPKPPYPRLDPDEAEAAQQYLKDAITYLNSGNNDKAIELLGKCIGIDNVNLNAYTLRAMINARTGKTKEACKDWTTLAGLGQVSAVKNLAKYCK